MNNLIDLKKKYFRSNFYYTEDNFLNKQCSESLFSVLNLIKIDFKKVLIIQPGVNVIDLNNSKLKNYKEINFIDIENVNENYDLIISNLSIHLEIALDPMKYLKILNSILNKNGLLLINFLNDYSFITIKKIILEIDEYIFNGAYQRFGPFANTQKIINLMSKNNFSEIIATNDILEVNYKNLKKLRLDIKLTATGNYNLEKARFNRNLLIKLQNIFEKLNVNEKFMPLEFDITTISAWK